MFALYIVGSILFKMHIINIAFTGQNAVEKA